MCSCNEYVWFTCMETYSVISLSTTASAEKLGAARPIPMTDCWMPSGGMLCACRASLGRLQSHMKDL